jgi:hypothetical protein
LAMFFLALVRIGLIETCATPNGSGREEAVRSAREFEIWARGNRREEKHEGWENQRKVS